jgi:5-dehydro-4-deoxyglucarate dehydratase
VLSKPLSGVLFFPVTPFSPQGAVDLVAYRRHLERGLRHQPGGIFAACGTGEFHALSLPGYGDVVSTTVKTAAGAVPVFAGAGGAPPTMREQGRLAKAAGADGLLGHAALPRAIPWAGTLAGGRAGKQHRTH